MKLSETLREVYEIILFFLTLIEWKLIPLGIRVKIIFQKKKKKKNNKKIKKIKKKKKKS